jgi:type IV secretion system protein VirB10
MPRYTQYVVLGVIAVVVLLATFWSGGKPRKAEERTMPSGPTPNQLQSFQQTLERQRREAGQETEARQQGGRQAQAAQAPQATFAPGPANAPDAVIEQDRRRAASAPFASSYIVRAAPQASQDTPRPDLTTQIIALTPSPIPVAAAPSSQTNTGQSGQADAKKEGVERPKESGRRLPPREGELFRLYEGTLVHASLANRLDGSFTGPVNCAVSTPVIAQDEKVTLIPVGSRFLGKANKVEAENQTRLAVTFKRLILPNGYSVDLEAAPGLDGAGETGLKGKVDNHNMSKFGIAGAVGLLGGLALYAGQANPYAAGFGNSTGSSATNILNHYLNRVPTITVPEGHPVNVYLPGDLLLPPYRP